MSHHRRLDPGADLVSEAVASQLLARASELDAARAAGFRLTELRAAATAAGISASAFDAALDELRAVDEAAAPDLRARRRQGTRRWRLAAVIAALVTLGAAFGIGRRAPGDALAATTPKVTETFLLRCLSPGEAAALVRPHLAGSAGAQVYAPGRAARVLTVSATPAQMEKVRSVLEQHERAGSTACAARPATTR